MNITKEIYDIVSHHSFKKTEDLSVELYIEQDLKLFGDDASELLEEIQKKFDIDFSSFDFTLHFSPEVGWPENPRFGYYPVTVGHLIKVAELKCWFLPEENEANFIKAKKHTFVLKAAIVVFLALIFCVAVFVR